MAELLVKAHEVAVKNTRKIRWGIVGMVVMAGIFLALIDGNWIGYLKSSAGVHFKALSGGLIGWLISRYVCGLDLSSTAEERRPIAGLSQAILIVGWAIAIAHGA